MCMSVSECVCVCMNVCVCVCGGKGECTDNKILPLLSLLPGVPSLLGLRERRRQEGREEELDENHFCNTERRLEKPDFGG